MLLTFSGLDGAGKSTQINLLVDWFEKRGNKVSCLWARGGYTPGFEILKRFALFLSFLQPNISGCSLTLDLT